MQKRNMKNKDLLKAINRINEKRNETIITRQYMCNVINGIRPLSACMARKIEIALDIEKYSIVSMIGFPAGEKGMKKLLAIDEIEE